MDIECMMCSMFKLNKTIQDVTQEIINIMSLYEFPQIPFTVKGYLEELITLPSFILMYGLSLPLLSPILGLFGLGALGFLILLTTR